MKGQPKQSSTVGKQAAHARWQLARDLRSAPGAIEILEWAGFALLPDARSRVSLRALVESYETYLVSEGLVPLRLRKLLCFLVGLGLEVRGVTVRGARLNSALPPLRLLTRLELYGFRFRHAGQRLAWHAPESLATRTEERVIERNRDVLLGALEQIAQQHRQIRGEMVAIVPPRLGRASRAA